MENLTRLNILQGFLQKVLLIMIRILEFFQNEFNNTILYHVFCKYRDAVSRLVSTRVYILLRLKLTCNLVQM